MECDYRLLSPYYTHWVHAKRVGVVKAWLRWKTFEAWADVHHRPDMQLIRKNMSRPHSPRNSYFAPQQAKKVTGTEPYSNNILPRRGVNVRPYGRYQARITVNGRTLSLGYYDDFESAVKAREAGERKYFKPIIQEAIEADQSRASA